MLTIRLSRQGRKKLAVYRIVVTEHTKPVHAGYHDQLGSYDPVTKAVDYNLDLIKTWIAKWAFVSSRVAKLLYAKTNDDIFAKFVVKTERVRKKKKSEE